MARRADSKGALPSEKTSEKHFAIAPDAGIVERRVPVSDPVVPDWREDWDYLVATSERDEWWKSALGPGGEDVGSDLESEEVRMLFPDFVEDITGDITIVASVRRSGDFTRGRQGVQSAASVERQHGSLSPRREGHGRAST